MDPSLWKREDMKTDMSNKMVIFTCTFHARVFFFCIMSALIVSIISQVFLNCELCVIRNNSGKTCRLNVLTMNVVKKRTIHEAKSIRLSLSV